MRLQSRPVNIRYSQSPRLARNARASLYPLHFILLTFLATMALTAAPVVGLKEVASGFTSPIAMVPMGDGSGRMLIADQVGTVHVLSKKGKLEEKLYLDLRSKVTKLNEGFDERGLLGLAPHPEFKRNHRLFVYYSAPLRSGAPEGWNHTAHLSEFKASANGVDLSSERVIFELDEPAFNHDGGCIAFGPDGYLYIAIGDGGDANDAGIGHSPQGNGQDTSNLYGTICRIDVNQGTPYGIPADNPFATGKGKKEIYAYGLRNPWRISFDRGGTHQLFAADIGQTLYEEVNIIVKGGNYGWRVREGFHCFDPNNPNKSPADCSTTGPDGKPFQDPILEYKNANGFRRDREAHGISVTGGYVYRGKAIPALQGHYVFGDWSSNWALPRGTLLSGTPPSGESRKWTLNTLEVANLSPTGLGAYVTAFGQDEEGELYVLTNGRNSLTGTTGKVFKLVPNG